ncbi:MAG: hypothetical protein KDA91_19700 [Planctomycetaceae bacterium]|nr:hypothetical protein [Planctomycetaceae bacterium]
MDKLKSTPVDVGPSNCPACGVPFTEHAGVTLLCRQLAAYKSELNWLLSAAQTTGAVDEVDIAMALRRAELSSR